MSRIYSKNLVDAAKELSHSGAFKTLLNHHLENLASAIVEADDREEILKAHAEHAALRNFAEYLQILVEQ